VVVCAVIPALGKQWQEDCKFEASLGYTDSDTLSPKTKKTSKQQQQQQKKKNPNKKPNK
jgi:hypothetical protein